MLSPSFVVQYLVSSFLQIILPGKRELIVLPRLLISYDC